MEKEHPGNVKQPLKTKSSNYMHRWEKNPGQWHKLCLLYDHRIKLPQTEESHTHTDKRSTQKPN